MTPSETPKPLTEREKIFMDGLEKIATEAAKCGKLMEDNQPSQKDLMNMALSALDEADKVKE